MTTIQELRQNKWKIKIYHFRYYSDYAGNIWFKTKMQKRSTDNLFQKGGETRLEITNPNGEFDYESAICRPDFRIENGQIIKQAGDAYNRKLGVKIALGRYLKRNKLNLV